jgi:hypothetical protein
MRLSIDAVALVRRCIPPLGSFVMAYWALLPMVIGACVRFSALAFVAMGGCLFTPLRTCVTGGCAFAERMLISDVSSARLGCLVPSPPLPFAVVLSAAHLCGSLPHGLPYGLAVVHCGNVGGRLLL